MNYLAHLFLARGTPEFRAGALAGDFLRGILPPEAGDGFLLGVRHHRAVDAFTDAHPDVATCRHRMPQFRHFSRVIVDVFFDHFLARTWKSWSPDEDLSGFAARTYGDLLSQIDRMPPEMRLVVHRMAAGDWLTTYGDKESIRRALAGISVRIRRPVDLAKAADILSTPLAETIEGDFRRFFPHVREYSERLKSEY